MICITVPARKVNTKENTFITITNKILKSTSNCSLLCYHPVKIKQNSPATQKQKATKGSTLEEGVPSAFRNEASEKAAKITSFNFHLQRRK